MKEPEPGPFKPIFIFGNMKKLLGAQSEGWTGEDIKNMTNNPN